METYSACAPGLYCKIFGSDLITRIAKSTYQSGTTPLLVSTILVVGIVENCRIGGQANDYTSRFPTKDIGELRNGVETFSV